MSTQLSPRVNSATHNYEEMDTSTSVTNDNPVNNESSLYEKLQNQGAHAPTYEKLQIESSAYENI